MNITPEQSPPSSEPLTNFRSSTLEAVTLQPAASNQPTTGLLEEQLQEQTCEGRNTPHSDHGATDSGIGRKKQCSRFAHVLGAYSSNAEILGHAFDLCGSHVGE